MKRDTCLLGNGCQGSAVGNVVDQSWCIVVSGEKREDCMFVRGK